MLTKRAWLRLAKWRWIHPATALLAVMVVSCAPNRNIDYASYERLPIKPASATFRILAKSNPLTDQAAFYGNYGGPGNSGGEPRDEMDELFRRHDIVYNLSRTKETMLVADQELVEGLEGLETRHLDARGEKFRQRAIEFFRSPLCRVIGKPLSTFFCRQEKEDCYFCDPEVVREFFSEDHPGVPEATQGKAERRKAEVGSRKPEVRRRSRVGSRKWKVRRR